MVSALLKDAAKDEFEGLFEAALGTPKPVSASTRCGGCQRESLSGPGINEALLAWQSSLIGK
ncbi:hypothetical protein PHLCEN_2v3970 [Hermanssonia centrifuga]|uniref:Uncharacterized protein n=1 Tax=Hermanssonia centrifuga TaxID=98765 RepID=A0A2R6Q7J9_9APHY|nr:hypothetical protein PHLCEN_2v3970 [Hermanssonia centrifuga]